MKYSVEFGENYGGPYKITAVLLPETRDGKKYPALAQGMIREGYFNKKPLSDIFKSRVSLNKKEIVAVFHVRTVDHENICLKIGRAQVIFSEAMETVERMGAAVLAIAGISRKN